MQELIENYGQQFAQLDHHEEWICGLRQQGLTNLSQVGFPTTGDENWRYTNIKPLLKQAFNIVTHPQANISAEQLSAFEIKGFDSLKNRGSRWSF